MKGDSIKLDSLIEGHEGNYRMQKCNYITSIYGGTSLPIFFSQYSVCPEHISESIEGN